MMDPVDIAVASIILFLLFVAGLFVYKVASADGKVDYCSITYNYGSGNYYVEGHRSWRIDRNMSGDYNRLEDAISASKLASCPEVH